MYAYLSCDYEIIILLLAVCMVFSFVSCDDKTPVKPEEVITNKIVGTGTAQDPYAIRSLEAFKQVGSEEWQAMIEKGENEETYYKLECDIDLSKEPAAKFFIKAFGGILDGDGHTIKGNNNIPFIFYYFFEDTTIKNLKIDFDTNSITRLWSMTAIKGTPVDGDLDNVAYDKSTIDITLENVDFIPTSENSYFIGDNNAGLYQYDTTSYGAVLCADGYKGFWISNFAFLEKEAATYTITLKNCDVDGNYNGGFGKSGAAIFFGGQLWGADVVLDNCTFNGTLEGLNVAILMGNHANCDESRVTLNNVQNKGKIVSFTDKGSLLYGNGTTSAASVRGKVSGNEIEQVTPTLALTKPAPNKAFDFSALSEGTYELKLFLPSVYTYDGETFLYQTNSNTITVPVTKETTDFFLAKVISTDDAKAASLTLKDWAAVETASKEGAKYQFAEDGTDKYLVINYGTTVKKFYTKNVDGNDVAPAYMLQAMLLQHDTTGKISAVSALVSLK